MKISDFLRMKITPDNKQFDSIKNIRFYDDKSNLLVGKGTTSVHAFCEAFFDYVYRNYSSARGAEKLVKSNRKKYTKFSGSESMILVQRILDEICDEYAITNYSITCEVDNGNAKKAVPAAQASVDANKKAGETAAVNSAVSENKNIKTDTVNAQPVETRKIKALSSQLERMQNNDKETKPQQSKPQESFNTEESYIHPVIDESAARKNNPINDAEQQIGYGTASVPEKQSQPKEILYNAMGQIITDLDTDDTQIAEAPVNKEAANGQQDSVKLSVTNQNVSDQNMAGQGTANQSTAGQNAANRDAQYQNSWGSNNSNVKNSGAAPFSKKDKKHGKKQNIQDPRMKPGKENKPFKPNENFKAATKFQKAENNYKKSNLNIDEIPCIAVKEENIIPSMEEVPFIGIPEENNIPNMSDVPFVGVEENVSGKDISEIPYVGIEDGEAGKAIPDVPYLGYEQREADMPIPDVPFIVAGDFYDPDDASEEQIARSEEYEARTAGKEEVTLQEKIAEHEIQQAGGMPIIRDEQPEQESNDQSLSEDIEEPGEVQSEQTIPTTDTVEAAQVAQSVQQVVNAAQPAQQAANVAQSVQQVVNAAQPAQQAANVAQPAQQAANVAQPAQQAANVAQPVQQAANVAQPVQQAVNVAQPAQQAVNVAQPAQQAVNVAQPLQSAKKVSQKTAAAKDIKQIIALVLLQHKQVVFTGPSATGKTYQVRKYARRNAKGYDGYKFVQFHPAFEYSDFIEGLRPVNIINTTNPTNVRLDGVFKAFCRRIVEDNLEHAVTGFSTLYAEKKQKVLQELFENIRDKKEALEDGTETEDFARDSKEYVFEHGVREYYFVIDEINRADIASVFGDALFALDEDYRGIENRFDTRLGNLKTYRIIQAEDIGKANYSTSHIGFAEQMKFDCFERGFFIPHNLHIIATMNELRGSEGDVDISFRQKFRWVNIKPAEIMSSSLREMLKGKDIDWIDQFANNLNLVNNLISEGFSEEYCLGPAFFRKLDASPESIDEVFEMDVAPILKEYLKDKPGDISEVFIAQCRKALKMGI